MKMPVPTGETFGMLTVIREAKPAILPSGQKNRVMRCKCQCGKIKNVRLLHLVRLRTISCGCLNPKHGDVGSGLHNTWRGMLNRVTNESYIDAHRYIKRGISVYEPWRKYLTFKNWALNNGYKEGLQIDRINNDDGYYPNNCRFVTPIINGNNRENTFMVNYKGENQSFMLLVRRLNLMENAAAIRGRIHRGWDHTKAIDTPIRVGNYARR